MLCVQLHSFRIRITSFEFECDFIHSKFKMGDQKLSPDVVSVLENAFGEKLSKFKVIVHDEDTGGMGYMGDKIFLTLKNKTTKENLDLVVKKTLPSNNKSNRILLDCLFFNEIHFYKTIWSEIDKFQQTFPGGQQCRNIPKFYGSGSEPGKEMLVLENLKSLGFEMFPRDGTFDDKLTKLLMISYGKFHGVSAAFRKYNLEEYERLTKDLMGSTEIIVNADLLVNFIKQIATTTMNLIENEDMKEKMKKYVEKSGEIIIETSKYNGKNPVVNHGDCWSNNLMFKFDKTRNPVEIRLIDFQLCRSGSVVPDLSYLIYSGATKDIHSNLDHYLKIYHDSFSNTLRSYKLDTSKIFTFEDLKKEWKDHCQYGFLLSNLLWGNKLAKSYEKRNFVEMEESGGLEDFGSEESMETYQVDKVKLNTILLDLVEHLYENDWL